MTTTVPAGRLPSAGPWRRFMCIAYECVLLFGVLFFFGYAFSALAQFKGQPGAVRWLFQGFVILVLAVYFGWSWSDGRRTLPMKTMSVRLERIDGRVPGIGLAVARFGVAAAMLIAAIGAAAQIHAAFGVLLVLPFAWTLVDRDHRALYDIACGTRLVFSPRDDLDGPTPAA